MSNIAHSHRVDCLRLLDGCNPPMVMASWRPKCHQKKMCLIAAYEVRNASSKIELVQSVNMANCWPKRAAQGTQLKRCRPLSPRSRDSTAALPQRGHMTPLGQRNCRK